MVNKSLILVGKLLSFVSRRLNIGSGSTWPGHIALSINPSFIKDLLKKSDLTIVLIAGTNGKTTTSKLIRTILEANGKTVIQNESGANLINGIASSLLLHSSIRMTLSYDYAIFEIDENSFPIVLRQFAPDAVILLNLFRDQLDRYGEVNTISTRWHKAVQTLPKNTTLIANADDPQIAHIALNSSTKTIFFGLDDKTLSRANKQHASDSTFCPNCGAKLDYSERYFSHLGNWKCSQCKLKRPDITVAKIAYYPISGIYNKYNIHAAVAFAKAINLDEKQILLALQTFTPAFGRQEKLEIEEKTVQVFLSKNPTSFNESLRTSMELSPKTLLFVLNDRIPDGRDVSWIWDIDFEELLDKDTHIVVSGDRVYDMALRLKYADVEKERVTLFESLEEAVTAGLNLTGKEEKLCILPTYSAMLEVRKILTGRKIL